MRKSRKHKTNRLFLLLMVVSLVSGACSLVYQQVWLREFRMIFGGSTAATSAVLAVFIGGLGFGALVFGKRATKIARPLKFYAKVEFMIGVLSLLTPVILILCRSAYIWLQTNGQFPHAMSIVLRFAVTLVAIGGPCFLMGGTLPLLLRALGQSVDDRRSQTGWIYGANAIGGMMGLVAAAFIMFESIGIRSSLYVASLLNIALSMGVFLFARGEQARTSNASVEPARSENFISIKSNERNKTSDLLLYFASFMSGMAFFMMELVWYRMFAPLLGGTTYSFAVLLVVILVGIGAGGLSFGWFASRIQSPRKFIALTFAVQSMVLMVTYAIGDSWARLALSLLPNASFTEAMVDWFIIAGLALFVPSFVAGFQFPLMVSALGKGSAEVAPDTGRIYIWNTIGSIVGVWLGGMLLIPLLGAESLWCVISLMLILTSWLLSAGLKANWKYATILVSVIALMLVIFVTGPTAALRHTPIGAGRVDPEVAKRDQWPVWRQEMNRRTMDSWDGVESSLAIAKSHGLAMIVNGKSDGNGRLDASTQIMPGMLSAWLHPDPKNAVVLGLGSGSTAGWLAQVPSIDKVDVIEFEPTVERYAKRNTQVNQAALQSKKVSVIRGDAREQLQFLNTKYDLIISQPSNPYRSGVASLFTKEFYERSKLSMNSDGFFVQWLQAYEVDTETVRMVVATLATVFKRVEIWQTDKSNLLLIASEKPNIHSISRLRDKLKDEPFRQAFKIAWHVDTVEGAFARYVAAPPLANEIKILYRRKLNTDQHPLVEFRFARSLGQEENFFIESLHTYAAERKWGLPESISGQLNLKRLEIERLMVPVVDSKRVEEASLQRVDLRLRANFHQTWQLKKFNEAGKLWTQIKDEPTGTLETLILADLLAERASSTAVTLLEKVRQTHPIEVQVLTAKLKLNQGNVRAAERELKDALTAMQTNPWTWLPIQEQVFEIVIRLASQGSTQAANLFDLLKHPFAGTAFDRQRRLTLVEIGTLSDTSRAAEAIEAFEPHVPLNLRFLELREQTYRDVDHPMHNRALQDLKYWRGKISQ